MGTYVTKFYGSGNSQKDALNNLQEKMGKYCENIEIYKGDTPRVEFVYKFKKYNRPINLNEYKNEQPSWYALVY